MSQTSRTISELLAMPRKKRERVLYGRPLSPAERRDRAAFLRYAKKREGSHD